MQIRKLVRGLSREMRDTDAVDRTSPIAKHRTRENIPENVPEKIPEE